MAAEGWGEKEIYTGGGGGGVKHQKGGGGGWGIEYLLNFPPNPFPTLPSNSK